MAGESMAGQQTGAKRRVARAGIDVRSTRSKNGSRNPVACSCTAA
jgi:hypothetical protein